MNDIDTAAVLAEFKAYHGPGPDALRTLCAALDEARETRRELRGRLTKTGAVLDRVWALLDDTFITDDGTEVVHAADLEHALRDPE